MKKIKRLLFGLLVICLVAVITPVTARAETTSGKCGDDITWEISADGVLTLTGTGDMWDYGYMGAPWFDIGQDRINKVVISDGITSIGKNAFQFLKAMTDAVIGKDVTDIMYSAFRGSGLTHIDIPDNVIWIEDRAFMQCERMETVTIGSGVQWISSGAFATSSSVLKGFFVDENNPCFATDEYNALYQIRKQGSSVKYTSLCQVPTTYQGHYTIVDGITSIDNYAFAYCKGLTGVTIPESVTSIKEGAFHSCTSLTEFTIPQTISTISNSVFYKSGLTSIVIPDNITCIEANAFYGCSDLTTVTISSNTSDVNFSAFPHESGDALTGIFFNENHPKYSSDKHGAVFNKNKTELLWFPVAYQGHYAIPDGVTAISSSVFSNCIYLTGVTLPDSITSIGYFAFSGCTGLTSMVLPKGITEIKSKTFEYCSNLQEITLPDGITSIGSSAFYYCTSLVHINIPDSTTEINDSAFYHCESLPSIMFPSNLNSIGSYAFEWCYSMEYMFFRGNAPSIGTEAFYGDDIEAYYPAGDSSWKSSVRKHYGGYIDWFSYKQGETPWNILYPPVIRVSNVTSSGNTKLTWDAVDGADSYIIYYSENNHGRLSMLKQTTGTSVTHKAAPGSTYYYFAVSVAKDGKVSKYSKPVPGTAKLAQPVITMSNVSSTGKIKVSWEKVDGAVEYEVYRATSKDGTYTLKKTTTGTSYTNTSANTGKTYYYKVKAIATNHDADSAYSKVKSRTCDLPQPEISLSNVASSGKVKVTWEKVDGAVKYEVYRATSRDGAYTLKKTTTGTSFTNTSATAGKTYYYKVRAIAEKSAADSDYSEIKSRTCDLARPNVSVTLSSGKPMVSWDKVDGAVKYEVYRATSENGTYTLKKTTTGTSYTNTAATAGKTYYYKVKAIAEKTSANSANSTIVSIKSN